jgi:hypothetical protein
MSKAEKFIQDCTRNCSNELIAVESRAGKEVISYHEWLTPDQARRAVEIAREEMIDKFCEFLDNDLCGYIKAQDFTIEHQRLENDLKQAMNNIKEE